MNIDAIAELFDRSPRKENATRIDDVFTRGSNGKKVSLADCTDDEFEKFLSPMFSIKQRNGEWTIENRQAIIDQLEYLLDWIVD